MKKIAILQSNYIPWKGYFDMIAAVDEFVLYDDVQYTKRDWRNRNLIKTAQGLHWLTIPILTRGKYTQTIFETKVSDPFWSKKHWDTIKRTYGKSDHFNEFSPPLEEFFLNNAPHIEFLSHINFNLMQIIKKMLGIHTPISWSSQYDAHGDKSDKLLEICKKAGVTHYLSGPAAKCYLDEALFNKNEIQIEWMDYSGYPEYPQKYPPFEHGVSIIDLIFNEGSNSKNYMKRF